MRRVNKNDREIITEQRIHVDMKISYNFERSLVHFQK